MRKYFALFLIFFLLSGCKTAEELALKMGYQKKTATELQINKLQEEFADVIKAKTVEIETKYENVLAQTNENFQNASNWLYGANLASDMKFDKNRLDLLLDYRLKTAAKYSLAPTIEAMAEQNKLLKEELDETKISNAQLAERYDAIQLEAEKSQVLLKEKDLQLEKAKQERTDLEKKYNDELLALQNKLIEESNRIIALEKQRADDRAAIQKAKMKASFALGGLALLALAGAIYSPIAKDKCAIFAGVVGAAAVGVWYIEAWMITLGLGIIVVGVIGYILYRLQREKTKAQGSMWTLQKIRETNPDIHENISKKELKDWFDESMHKEIEKDLQDMNATYVKK